MAGRRPDPPTPDRPAGPAPSHDWWHTIELGGGAVTPGWWDLRAAADRVPWPESLAGMRCLDVGTMDGFWAFELERRGAAEVLAVDLADAADQDRPRGRTPRARSPRGATFHAAAGLRGSRVRYLHRDVYDLTPASDRTFDLVVMGYVLQLLRDPLRALEAVRGVCRGWLLVIDTVSAPLSLLPAPLARLAARSDGDEWFVFNRAGLARALTLTGFDVRASTGLVDRPGPAAIPGLPAGTRLRHLLGLRGRSLALLARAC